MMTASPCSGPLLLFWSAPFLDAAPANRRLAETRAPRRGSSCSSCMRMAEQQKQNHWVER